MRRWNYILFLIIFLSSFLFLGSMSRNADAASLFGKDKNPPRAIVVFVDMSGSTNKARRTVYRNAFDKIYQNLKEGDRLVVGTITSHLRSPRMKDPRNRNALVEKIKPSGRRQRA